LSGVSQDAGSVSVSLDDQNGATAPVTATATPAPATGKQTWTVTIPAAQVRGLSDGTLTATPTFTGAAALPGGALKLLKDTVAPPAPTAGPGPATYTAPQSVTLADADGTATIRWTNDGATPTATSPAFTSAINVTASQTIRALAVDTAGNTGPVAAFAYTIATPTTAGTTPAPVANDACDSVARPVPLLIPGLPPLNASTTPAKGAAVKGLTVTRTSVAGLRRNGLRVSMELPAGSRAVSLRIYRARGGQVTGRALLSTVRSAPADGRYVVSLRGSAIRRLRAGRYLLQVRAGASRQSLKGVVSRTFIVG
ncbi:MAG: hypothetical protein QOH46_1872, partial [Solirubrobacteraceae bacterium]|nr:hypothetical protein [Solirubrobacteraceae bacterium]